MNKPNFHVGRNIAIKIPTYKYEKTVSYYRDVLGFPLQKSADINVQESWYCDLGHICLWLDRVDTQSQTDIWLELKTDDLNSATDYLRSHDVPVRDELENFPDNFDAHWISDPAGVVFLLNQ